MEMELSGINIKLYDFDEQSVKVFADFFSKDCHSDFNPVDTADSADLLIIDLDTRNNLEVLSLLREKYPSKPLVVLTSTAFNQHDGLTFILRKPLSNVNFYHLLLQLTLVTADNQPPAEELKNALLQHIQDNMLSAVSNVSTSDNDDIVPYELTQFDAMKLSRLVGRHEDIDISNPQATMRILFDPNLLLIGVIRNVVEKYANSTSMILVSLLDNQFLYDPEKHEIYTFINQSLLRLLCLMGTSEPPVCKPLDSSEQELTLKKLMRQNDTEIKRWPIDEFLWLIALWSSRGKIPRDINLNIPVKLTKWPDFTKLEKLPYALSIAALLSRQPMRLNDIAQRLKIEQRFVFAFYSAANAIGAAANSQQQSDTLFIAENTKVKVLSFLKKLSNVFNHRAAGE